MICAWAFGTLLFTNLLSALGLDPAESRFTLIQGEGYGFRPTGARIRVASVEELRDPGLEVVWEQPLDLPVYKIPPEAKVFAREKHTGAPLVAGFRRDGRALLWTAAEIGPRGYERFPYLLHALVELGVEPPFRGSRLWAFFDSSYRLRADAGFLARRWRQAGIAAIHAAAWHYYDPDPARDAYLRALIEACHRQGILVYAWVELPHVSEKFWNDHPPWREKTAIGQDAHLDWRKLMNLADPHCARQVEAGLRALIERFDWDGVNLAELYFESLHGPADPQRFTPLNDTVRRDFLALRGFDPLDLFQPASLRYWQKDRKAWAEFVEYRVALARRLQLQWLDAARRWRPDLDVVITYTDDRFDTRMREYLGADAAALLRQLAGRETTFIVQDPATTWHLGPERYAEIARRYDGLAERNRLAVDINIVERYQDVYPTKKQTGGELLQLIRQASLSFARVMLYAEHSIAAADYPLLAAAAAPVTRCRRLAGGLEVESSGVAGVRWSGPARVNGVVWPAADDAVVWVPAGRHRIEPASARPPFRLLRLSADLLSARVVPGGIEFDYQSGSRAAALLDAPPARIEVDGRPADPPRLDAATQVAVLLPAGRRRVRILR